MRFQGKSLCAFMVVLLVCGAAIAQTSRGTITGTVMDSTGAVVSGATVKILQTSTGLSRQTTSNAAGIYRFDAVDLGTYVISSQAQGFSTEEKRGVIVEAAHTVDIDFALKPGAAAEIVTVEASTIEVGLQTSEQVHNEVLSEVSVQKMPIVGGDSLTLAQLAPGVAIGSQANQNAINQNGTFFFAVNGQRPRGNNFLIDGVENNDISVTGPSYTIRNPDAIQEVSIQTANFSAEYGRAGGAVFNQITKSGSSQFHGTATEVYTGSAFQALNHLQKTSGITAAPRQVENIPDFTFGGPVILPKIYDGRGKTFFFGAAQWDRRFGNVTSTVVVPDAAGVTLLQSLAPQCPNAALYLQALGGLVSNTTTPSKVSLAVPSGGCNGTTRTGMNLTTGNATRVVTAPFLDNNHEIRIDHTASNKQILSFKWLYDSSTQTPSGLNNLPGFDSSAITRNMIGGFTDTYTFTPTTTNEFRFNYGRLARNIPSAAVDAFHANLPLYSIGEVTGFGVANNVPQFRFANNWQYQDTVSLVRGRHTFRLGADFLRQLARQHPPFLERGSLTYQTTTAATGNVTGFANFLDDFGGDLGALSRQFGISVYHPNLFRQSYFFQDSWKTTSNLTLNLGIRYEYFGAPENSFITPGFTNFDPIHFAAPNKVPSSKFNFGPSVGFAWTPKGSAFINRWMGGEKTVWRGGLQVSYDNAFNNLLSNIAGSSPNTLGGNIISPASGRGDAGFSTLFGGIVSAPATVTSAQNNLFLGRFPNPQTDRWSLGFQRELPAQFIWETSYVGSVSHHLYQTLDMNPLIGDKCGSRFMPQLQDPLPGACSTLSAAVQKTESALRSGEGIRTVRAASANSNYESLQIGLKRGFKSTLAGDVQFEGSYTYAHYLDDASDVFAFDSTPSSFQSAPQILGFSPRVDYGNSDFDRRHVAVFAVLYAPRAPKTGVLGEILGGWTFSGIPHWQSGVPFSVRNGPDRGGFGQGAAERPDISNLAAPLNTRAVINSSCPTGFANPDVLTGGAATCWDPTTVHWIQGTGAPNANTVGRNTLRTPFVDNVDFSVAKRFRFTEKTGLQFRADLFNAFNTTNLGFDPTGNNFVPRTVNGSSQGRFMDFNQTDSIGRSMRVQAKFEF
jgi:outer membrane receptor protein involved in Fe transport